MHLSYQEHVKIYRGLCGGLSMREIASSIGRHTSTVTGSSQEQRSYRVSISKGSL